MTTEFVPLTDCELYGEFGEVRAIDEQPIDAQEYERDEAASAPSPTEWMEYLP